MSGVPASALKQPGEDSHAGFGAHQRLRRRRLAGPRRLTLGPDLLIYGEPVAEMPLTSAGFEGEVHSRPTRSSCLRVLALLSRNTPIANTRQLSLVSVEEMAAVTEAMGLATMDYAHVGASVVVEGMTDFTHIRPFSRLQGSDGATLVVDFESGPCLQPAKTIEQAHPGHSRHFKPAAEGPRGITAWVE